MPKKPLPSAINQTAIGNDNIQVVGSNNIITRITNFVTGNTEQIRWQRNRRAMLKLVKNTWIKGVLDQSLYNEVLIELGMEERLGAVRHPWDTQVKMPNKENRILPPGSPIVDVFDEMNGAMLILGEPGSGKTTTLLELARDCIVRAEQDNVRPIPVVFNLSSWNKGQSIDNWLVNELRSKYSFSKRIAYDWVSNNDLHLLLDGLDEVNWKRRNDCVEAINDFRQKHGSAVPIVVCSRLHDYEALTEKLSLSGAILIQSLTSEQIDEYFIRIGPDFWSVREAVRNDPILQELVKQPLMLSILTLAYLGATEAFPDERSRKVKSDRQYLFDMYINHMFERHTRANNKFASSEQTKRWLAWLAKSMVETRQTLYFVDQMQPDWLDEENLSKYNWTGLFIIGPAFAVLVGLLANQFSLLFGHFLIGPIVGIFGGVMTWLSVWSNFDENILLNTSEGDWAISHPPGSRLLIGPPQGLTEGLIYGFYLGVLAGLVVGITGGLTVGLTAGISVMLGSSIAGLATWLFFYRLGAIRHYILRFFICNNNYLPWRLTTFLNYCVDRIFLRKVGGGYIFIHRQLMEHFAWIYFEKRK